MPFSAEPNEMVELVYFLHPIGSGILINIYAGVGRAFDLADVN